MEYTKEDLEQIETFASIYLKISDIAVILDIPADVLRSDIADRTTDVSKAYRRGKVASTLTNIKEQALIDRNFLYHTKKRWVGIKRKGTVSRSPDFKYTIIYKTTI